MFEIFGLVFGGVSRLAQHWLDLSEKEKERSHEAVMFDKQVALQATNQKFEGEMKRAEYSAKDASDEWSAILASVTAQAEADKAAGGKMAALSASVRPMLAYSFFGLYASAKAAALWMLLSQDAQVAEAVKLAYTEFDATIMSSVISWYYADRSLRKNK
jgi:hypothetical protein